MGQYHAFVNFTKREYVRPWPLGSGAKCREQVNWPYSPSTALFMLLTGAVKGGARGGGDFRSENPLIGLWAGDKVAVVGDYSEREDYPNVSAKEYKVMMNSVWGDKEVYTDISDRVREMMAEEFKDEMEYKEKKNSIKYQDGHIEKYSSYDIVPLDGSENGKRFVADIMINAGTR